MTIKKKFLVPTALVIGGLLNIGGASAATNPLETNQSINKLSSSENMVKNLLSASNDLSGLVLTNSESGSVSLSHSSHRSHSSHSSHSSHRSHYSSR